MEYDAGHITQLALELKQKFNEKKFRELCEKCVKLIGSVISSRKKNPIFSRDVEPHYRQLLWEAVICFDHKRSKFTTHLYNHVRWKVLEENKSHDPYNSNITFDFDINNLSSSDEKSHNTLEWEELLDIAKKFRDKRVVEIIKMKFAYGMKWEDIGKHFGLTHQAVHKIFKEFCNYAKEQIIYN